MNMDIFKDIYVLCIVYLVLLYTLHSKDCLYIDIDYLVLEMLKSNTNFEKLWKLSILRRVGTFSQLVISVLSHTA